MNHPPEGTYDIIGDIHGHAEPLRKLLEKLGYRNSSESYHHPEGRRVVFLGDFIDRGPEIRETLHLVKSMIDAGQALAVMGNHEYNAVCFHTPDGKGDFLRSRTVGGGKNVVQHQATLDAFVEKEEEWKEWLEWFRQLPFALDLGGLRAVHATWSPEMIQFLSGKSLQDPVFLKASSEEGSPEFVAVETVLKGVEIPLPEGYVFTDKQGHARQNIRVRWWEQPIGKTYRQIAFSDSDTVPEVGIPHSLSDAWEEYLATEPPVFFGHYWMPSSAPVAPVSPNAACLDYSVAKTGGKLVAYRWDGETRLDAKRFVAVPTSES